MAENDPLDSPSANEQAPSGVDTPEVDSEVAEDDTEPLVRKLRDESAKYRTRAKDAEARIHTLSRELFALKVAALDKLADATDLEYNADFLDDPDALALAVDELLEKRPHYAKRNRPNGAVGQGDRGDSVAAPTFAALLQSRR
ncbi:hypothetical protein H7J06_05925 [Mycobacterium hodleri]|uniref:hypothetical protein n=1 Tax=Mycolicibacterium hodleri TaxID=49897 RepID=UPI0021F3500E|nr:hypothetical protein [Mycolicibacterium hodleri]MCV7132519.1 hypothetical protein [Mycolicibacterium hodleri]